MADQQAEPGGTAGRKLFAKTSNSHLDQAILIRTRLFFDCESNASN
jgi:hypothetical protein